MSTLERAIAIAAEAHAGQVDKGGEPYILHPMRVMTCLQDPIAQIVGALHDVVEDCPGWSIERIGTRGFPTAITEPLHLLTREPGMAYTGYVVSITRSGSSVARDVKVQDLIDNLRPDRLQNLSAGSRARLVPRYLWALGALAELAGSALATQYLHANEGRLLDGSR